MTSMSHQNPPQASRGGRVGTLCVCVTVFVAFAHLFRYVLASFESFRKVR